MYKSVDNFYAYVITAGLGRMVLSGYLLRAAPRGGPFRAVSAFV